MGLNPWKFESSQPHHHTIYHIDLYALFGETTQVMYKVMNSFDELHVYNRSGIYYFIRRIPADLRQFYSASRISFSLKTKSLATALRHAKSVRQKLEDYWLGLRLNLSYLI